MKLNKKKGFTIIELVIVIAVIGVLTAILVPVFINLTNKANEASDQTLVKNLNTVLATKEQELGYKTTTYQKVIDIVDDAGYKIPNLVAKSGEDLFWNQKTNRFYLGSKKDAALPDYTYWTIKDALDGTETYSVYAGLNFNAKTVNNLKAGFDVGAHNDITDINYIGGNAKQTDVTFRVQQDYFTNISNNNNNQDEVQIYGYANRVYSEKSGQHSLYINENVATLEIKEGHVVVAPGVKVGSLVFKATTTNNFDKIVVEIPNVQEQVTNIYRSNVSTNLPENVKVEVATIKTTQTSETYYLEGNGTIEDAKLLVSNTGDVADAQPVEEATASDAAKAIANAKVGDEVVDTGKNDEEIKEVIDNTQTEKQTEEAEKKAEEEGIDFSKYEARIGLVGYDTIREAINAAKAGQEVVLLKSVDSLGKISASDNVALSLKKDITLNGNGNTITTTAGRGIWIDDSNVSVSIKNLNISGADTAGKNKMERGIQVNGNCENVSLTLDNVTINAKTYAINICNGTTVNVSINNCDITGWGAINAWSAGYLFTIKNSTLRGINYTTDKTYAFGVVVLEGDSTHQTTMGSSNNKVTIDNCTIIADNPNDGRTNSQYCVLFNPNSKQNEVEISNTKFLADATIGRFCLDNGDLNVLKVNNCTYNGEEIEYAKNVYYYWLVNNQPVGGTYQFNEPFDNGYLMDGEFLELLSNVTLKQNVTANAVDANGHFTLTFGDYQITGEGKIVLPANVTALTDKAAPGLFVNSDGSAITGVETQSGFSYTGLAA